MIALRRAVIAFVVGLLGAVAVPAGAGAADAVDSARIKQVQSDVRTLIDANYTGDTDTALRLAHPVMIEALGGKEKARKMVKDAMATLQKLSLKIESLAFPQPPTFVAGKGRTYAVVPTRLVVTAGEQKLDSLNFQVGVLDDGATAWTYIEGSKFDAPLRSQHFPDFPADYEFPPTSRTP